MDDGKIIKQNTQMFSFIACKKDLNKAETSSEMCVLFHYLPIVYSPVIK